VSGRALTVFAPDGIGEVRAGDDLSAVLAAALPDLADGDIVVVSSKVVSKAEGRVVPGTDRLAAIAAETVREVARRGNSVIAETRHGFVMAAAGVDASNVEQGSLVLLPLDSDASARRIRSGLRVQVGARTGVAQPRLGVVVTDTFGRPWRHGQTDQAVGAAGVTVLGSLAGSTDRYGNPLAVTAPALADELAAAADLVKTKLAGRPVAVIRGLPDLLTDEDGPGAAALVRLGPMDMFRLGNREAVAEAWQLAGGGCGSAPAEHAGGRPSGAAEPGGEDLPGIDLPLLADLLDATGLVESATVDPDGSAVLELRAEARELADLELGRALGRMAVLLAGHGFGLIGPPGQLRVSPLPG